MRCLFNCSVYCKSIKCHGIYLFHRDFGASLAVYLGCGAVHVAFPGRFSAVRNTERADKKIKSVPCVLLKTKQNFMTVPKCIIDVMETRTI